MADSDKRPLIVKRKKVVGGDGHHGGAWKVAYADFVTAMMAFFMLMWLLNATTEKQRKGLADYFSPTISVSRTSGGGDGAFGGSTLFTSQTLAQSGIGGVVDQDNGTGSLQDQSAETEQLEEIQQGLAGRGGDSLVAEMMRKHVVTRLTDRGLVVEIFDLEDAQLFQGDTAIPTEALRAIAALVVENFVASANPIEVSAYSRSYPVTLSTNPAWELTTSRAQAMRQLLEDQALPPERMRRVTGYGQQKPLFADPMEVRNGRIEVVLLRQDQT